MTSAITLFRILLEKCHEHSEIANQAFSKNQVTFGEKHSAMAGAYFCSAAQCAETFGFNLRQEQVKWIALKKEIPELNDVLLNAIQDSSKH